VSAGRRPGLNKLCELEDFRHPEMIEAIREIEPDHVAVYPDYPAGREHRKAWEYAQLLRAARSQNVLRPDSMVLAVAAGHERPIFWLTNHVRMVFATDIYGTGDFAGREAKASILQDPDAFAGIPYNRRRLVVQYMNALDLRYEDDSFDMVFSLSSIEHFGGEGSAVQALSEQARVCRPGGMVAMTTECIVNKAPAPAVPGLYLFTPEALLDVVAQVPSLRLVEPPVFETSKATEGTVLNLPKVVEDLGRNHHAYPHIVLELENCWFTSVSLFLRKVV
jgi:SAM-dependent methyltransferase